MHIYVIMSVNPQKRIIKNNRQTYERMRNPMEKIRILADTSSDLSFEDAKKLGVELFSIPVFIDEKQYRDGVDFTKDEFYTMLEAAKNIPTTSHIPLSETSDAYLKAYNDGCEAVIHVCNNSANSGMFNTANLAKKFFFEEHPEAEGKFRIEPVDSHTFSLAYALPVIEGIKVRDKGGSVDEILERMDFIINSSEVYLSVHDLKYAKNSGRVSAASAFVGTMLGIKPIMSMIHGVSASVDKVRGDKAVVPRLVKAVKDNINMDEPYFYLVSGYELPETKQLEKALTKELGIKCRGCHKIGAAVSINIGPKVIAVFIVGKDRRANQ
ncbi:MAG: DegV family protein [Ruminococcaceae bacterium]|nr:DegV family protein [Oscillospiraceae bacterium]